MAIRNLYIQEISYNGSTYTKGECIDTLAYNIGISEIPFKFMPEFKEPTVRDWPGEDGVDVYVPETRRLKEYDMEIEFVYRGTQDTIHSDLRSFLSFFRHSRFAMYDDHTKIGRKDIICKSDFCDVDLFYYEDTDSQSVASFKLKFTVCDPVNDVRLVQTQGKNELKW